MNTGESQAMMALQQAQFDQQARQQQATSMMNSANEHQQKIAGMNNDSMRAMANDSSKRATEAQADAAALLKDTTQKLDQGAGA